MGDTQDFPWNTQRQTPNPLRRNPLEGYNKQPKKYLVNGREVPYYGLGALAYVLDRKTATIRDWEEKGWIPIAPKIGDSTDSEDPVTQKHGQRRLYPEELILGIYEIARQEGILEKRAKPIKETRFVQRVLQLFREYGVDHAQVSRVYNSNETEHRKDRA